MNKSTKEMIDKGWDYKRLQGVQKDKRWLGKKSGDMSKVGFTQEKAQAFNPFSFFSLGNLRATIDEGPRSRDQCNSSNLIGWKL